MKFKPQGSEKSYYGLQPLSMKVWRIDNSRYDHLAKELQTVEKFDLPGLWEGPIASWTKRPDRSMNTVPLHSCSLRIAGSAARYGSKAKRDIRCRRRNTGFRVEVAL